MRAEHALAPEQRRPTSSGKLMNGGRVRWEGATRSALRDKGVVPHLESPLPGWIGVGASPESVMGYRPLWLLADARDHRRPAGPLRTASSATSTWRTPASSFWVRLTTRTPSKLAGEGVIQPTGGAVELAFGRPSELSCGQSVTEGSYRWLVRSGKVQVAALVCPAAEGSVCAGKAGQRGISAPTQQTADKGIPESGWVRDIEVSTPMRHGGSQHVAGIALRSAVRGEGIQHWPAPPRLLLC